MSPEQAVGKPVDRRADIWSFGVVLLKMLTGKPLFHGETAFKKTGKNFCHTGAPRKNYIGANVRTLLANC
jgi:serine/threonine protein kinase